MEMQMHNKLVLNVLWYYDHFMQARARVL